MLARRMLHYSTSACGMREGADVRWFRRSTSFIGCESAISYECMRPSLLPAPQSLPYPAGHALEQHAQLAIADLADGVVERHPCRSPNPFG